MKIRNQLFVTVVAIAALVGFALPSHATVYLDDFWADGSRSVQNLPTESAWFASGSSITAATSNMTLTVGGSAVLVVTYFTTNSTTLPVQLNVGDTLQATFDLTFNGVPGLNSSEGFRIGLFDFYDSTLSPKRVTSDGSLSSTSGLGNGVQGYALFQNMATVFTNANLSPIDIRKRTNVTSSHLLSASGDWTTLGVGPGNSITGFPGFSNNVPYILQLSLQRTDTNSLLVTVSWVNTLSGASLTTSFTDNAATNFNFDGIALRPQDNLTAAGTTIFTEARVEVIPPGPPVVSADPQDQSIFVGQNASFTVLASGTAPLSYQWYYNDTNAVANATNSTLTVTNAAVSDSGSYFVLVSNGFGSVTSAVAQLSVTIPDPPSIITQPQDLTVLPGQSATFTVQAGGSEPFIYQWYLDTTTPVPNANDSTLTITNVQVANAGNYSVVVSNLAGTVTSSDAVLNVNTNPVAPSFTSQPISAIVLAGNTATFSASVIGTQPISFQWNINGTPIAGANSNVLTLINVQLSDDGNYTLTASNNVGSATSQAALLTVTPRVPVPNSAYNLVGFGQSNPGGGVISDNNTSLWYHVYTATDLAVALNSKTVKVIEIMNDLNLGYTEIPSAAKATSEPFRASPNSPLLHPVLLQTGVSVVDIQKKTGLTIFSANGSTIRHCKLNVKNCSNIIIRNLRFDELWEWDESSKGGYKENDWDFITLGDGDAVTNIWIDHCTFTKSYDGNIDTKSGCNNLNFSWCKYTGDDGATNPNSFVWQQINSLELNPSAYTMYNFLRSNGFSTTDIVTICQGHIKTMLVGQSDLDSQNATLTGTYQHNWFINCGQRLPRLRAGNVHFYNNYVDDTLALAAQRMRNQRADAMPVANQGTLNNTYDFQSYINGTTSTENGATLVERSVYLDCGTPLRNNETDPSKPAYTGKIMALDSIYHFDNSDSTTTDYRGDSTNAPGSTYFGPIQAPVIAFSWNLTGGQLAYAYYPDDAGQVQSIVTDPLQGAGAGVLTWNKTNWLATSYPPTGPVIVASPQSQTVSAGQNVSFVVVVGGSNPLSYQWYFNTNSPIANATNATLALTSIQATNVGAYSVIVSNSVGATNSALAMLTIPSPPTLTPFQSWQMLYFGCTNNDTLCTQAAPDADPYGKGISNFNQFLLGLNPVNPASVFRILSAVPQGNDVVITWAAGAGPTNVVQATGGDANGGYSTNYFTDISGPIAVPGSGDTTNNYRDIGGATYIPSRYYRIRLGP